MKMIKKKILVRLLFVFVLYSPVCVLGQIAATAVDKGADKTEVQDIIIVFKMHFDIGYTDWSESVLQKYTTSMMEETLASVKKTESLPKEDQFVWTMPGWPAKYILENASPQYRAEVEAAFKKGRFAVHALPFTVETESSDLETLVRGMSYSSAINRASGNPLVRGAKMTDVPSHSWVLPTLLTHAGVKILHIGCNSGSTSPAVPALFWWEGPDGSRVLTINWAEYYGSGVMPPKYWKYKTWMAMIHTHENTGAPTPDQVAAVLKEAREKAPNARVRIGQLEDFYEAIMKENPVIPVVKGDMPDTWIHGYMSMPREVKDNKWSQRLIYQAEALNTQLKGWGLPTEEVAKYVAQAAEKSLLFDEHTFGLAMSHGHQDFWKYGEDFVKSRGEGGYDYIQESWYEKGDHVHKALQQVMPFWRRNIRQLANAVDVAGKKVVVYNSLPWQRSGEVLCYTEIYQKNFTIKALKDESTGVIVPVNNIGNQLSFHASDLPSMGYKTYSVLTEYQGTFIRKTRVDSVQRALENDYFRLVINPKNGSLLSVFDKMQQKEMVGGNEVYGFGEYVQEKFGDEEIKRYNSAYVKPGQHGWADPEMTRPLGANLKYRQVRGMLDHIVYTEGVSSVKATAFCKTTDGESYSLSYTLYDQSSYVEVNWHMDAKKADPQPEGGWLAFPFDLKDPSFRLGRTGAVVDPTRDFIKNTNHDYYFLNTGLALFDAKGHGFGLNTPQAPGVSLDRPGLFRFSGEFIPKKPNVFVNLFNNQWGTNFTEWIEGSLSAKVYLWSIKDYAHESGLITPTEETRSPLQAVYVDGKAGKLPVSNKGVELSRKGVLVTAFGINTDGEGDVLRLWEQVGLGGECVVNLPVGSYRTAQLCNLRGEPLDKPFQINQDVLQLTLQPYMPVSVILK